jgi:hypothetical protein
MALYLPNKWEALSSNFSTIKEKRRRRRRRKKKRKMEWAIQVTGNEAVTKLGL